MFEDMLCRWQDRQLTCTQAGEFSGVGERSFRRYCRRFGKDGIEALCERRPGRKAARRVPRSINENECLSRTAHALWAEYLYQCTRFIYGQD